MEFVIYKLMKSLIMLSSILHEILLNRFYPILLLSIPIIFIFMRYWRQNEQQ